jgi:abnormal spindle-like microcephaly-associated protein
MSPMKLALKNFIVQRVLSDEATLAKYSKGLCKVPSGKFGEKYQAEMRTLVLHRLLVLFFFLDRARKAHVLDKSPRLFTKDAKVKSSRELLLEFCRQFLSAEGDFVKHLGRVGLKVFYKQEPVDELDFTVTNLAVDLRDGVRLARMTEILTGEPPKSLLVSLRLPAVSRLQKLHNVSVVLKTLRNFGVPLSADISSHHIVDGHREMVLKLMWSTLAHCCLKDLLDVEQVEAEIQRIRRCSAKGKIYASEADDAQQGKEVGDSSADYEEAELKSLLLRWCKAVCSCFGVQINDLTNDFADGKASCLLIHYYHPDSLYMDEIHPTTNDLPRNSVVTEAALEMARSNERANAVLANNRISELGGMPKMIPVCDTASVPAEKSMLLCLSFMCSRLMESGTEIRSCVLIQRRYRKYQNSILTEKKKSAALLIVRAWRENKTSYYQAQRRKYGSAIVVLQRFVKANQETLKVLGRQRRAKQNVREAAVFIQVSKLQFARNLVSCTSKSDIYSLLIFCFTETRQRLQCQVTLPFPPPGTARSTHAPE